MRDELLGGSSLGASHDLGQVKDMQALVFLVVDQLVTDLA